MAQINEWLSIDKNSGTGNSYITLTASSYEGLQDRATSLKVKTEGKEVVLNVRQTAFVNYFTLNKNLISPVWEGGAYSNYVVSNIGWSYTSSEWISLSVTNGSVGRTEFNVVAQPNTSEEVRIGYVNIVSNNGVTLGTIKVAQASHNEVNNIIFYTSTDGKKITPYSSTGVIANEYVDGVGALYYGNTITEVPQNLFRGSDTLASVSVPETVTTIKSGAFNDCDKLASYDFPDTLTTIEANAFRSCDSLAIFDFPSVETIGDYAFEGCPFETVILSDTLHTTGKYMFQYCSKLKTIQIGSGLTSISEYLCYGCSSLEAIDIPITIRRIEGYAFYACPTLETLYLHGGIEYIGDNAFRNNKLKSVVLGERTSALEYSGSPFSASTGYITDAYVTDIKSWFLWQPSLFTNLNSVRNLYVNGELLTEVVTPTDYNDVPAYAFYKNPHITSVTVTDNVTSVGTSAFNGLNNANYLYLGSRASYNTNCFSDFDGTLVLNNSEGILGEYTYFTKLIITSDTHLIGFSTVEEMEIIGDNIHLDTYARTTALSSLKTVKVDCNQLYIGTKIFQGATFLTAFDFSKVVSIGVNAFDGTSITELTDAPLLTSIGKNAFKNTKLKTVNLSNSPLTSIANYAFSNYNEHFSSSNYELTEVILPSLSYTIGSYVFQGCSNLKHIKMVARDIDTEIMEVARITGVYDTDIDATVDSRLEFDYKYTQSPSGDAYYEVIGAGNTDNNNVFQIRIQSNVFYFHIGSSQLTVSNVTPNVFHHFVVSLDEGVIIDGVQKGTFSRSDYTINAPFYINGIQYALNRNANGEFGTIKIDDVVITPKEDGFYNGDIKLNVVKSGVYEYFNEVVVKGGDTIPTINSDTFKGIAEYGFLEYPLVLDYAPWLSTNSYYLGYYKWNRFNLSATELDFDAADTYEVTVDNGVPYIWEITQLPFWLTASVMSGGEGTTTITFTKIADYVESDDIIFSITDVNYVIKAKYSIRELDLTNVDSHTIDLDTEGFTTSGVTDWLTVVKENGTTTFTGDIVYGDLSTDVRFTNGEESYVVRCVKDGSNTPLPKADNRIYYVGSLYNYTYTTNGNFVESGSIGGGCYYKEYDRPIVEVNDIDLTNTVRISLPSTLLYINKGFGSNSDRLREVDFGGSEIYIGTSVLSSCEHLDKYNLPQTLTYIGSCSLGGHLNEVSTMGAEIVNIGADMREICGCVFGGCGNIKRVNFWGEEPPIFSIIDCFGGTYVSFLKVSAEFHIPVGTKSAYEDAVSLMTDIAYLPFNFIDDLEAKPRTDYGENKLLMGTEKSILKPCASNRVISYWDGVNKTITHHSYGNDLNFSNETKEYSKTINGITFVYDVRGNGVVCKCNMSAEKNISHTYYYTFTAEVENLYNISFESEDYEGNTLDLKSNSFANNTYTRVYVTDRSIIANNYVEVRLRATDYYGTECMYGVIMSSYESKYPSGFYSWG